MKAQKLSRSEQQSGEHQLQELSVKIKSITQSGDLLIKFSKEMQTDFWRLTDERMTN